MAITTVLCRLLHIETPIIQSDRKCQLPSLGSSCVQCAEQRNTRGARSFAIIPLTVERRSQQSEGNNMRWPLHGNKL